jgi:hypothetical protein
MAGHGAWGLGSFEQTHGPASWAALPEERRKRKRIGGAQGESGSDDDGEAAGA